MAYEDVLRSLKIRSKLGLEQGVSVYRHRLPLSLEEHEVENRISRVEKFELIPGIAADVVNGTAAIREVANRNFMVAGTNMTSALATAQNDGGFLMTPAGANTDGCILEQHSQAGVSAFANVKWNTNKKLRFSTRIRNGAKIDNSTRVVGFKLTNTTVKATDDDQVMFYHKDDEANWTLVSSNDGTDTEVNSGVAAAVNTEYDLAIEVGADRVPYFYINDAYVGKGAALKANTDLKPVIALLSSTDASTTKTLAVRYLSCSRDY